MQFDIVIPAAGRGQRLGNGSIKSLISLGRETVVERQVRILKEAYPDSRVLIVGGHKHSKLHKSIPAGTGFVLNKDYQECNVAQSIKVGLERTIAGRPTLVIYGDLVFNRLTLPKWSNESAVIVDESESRTEEVGVSETKGYAIQFAFGLPTKWSHIAMLMPKEKQLFIESCHQRFFGYEILNRVIQAGGKFKIVRPEGMKLVEIDYSKDVPKAVELVNEDSV